MYFWMQETSARYFIAIYKMISMQCTLLQESAFTHTFLTVLFTCPFLSRHFKQGRDINVIPSYIRS